MIDLTALKQTLEELVGEEQELCVILRRQLTETRVNFDEQARAYSELTQWCDTVWASEGHAKQECVLEVERY